MNYIPPILKKLKTQLKNWEKNEIILFGSQADFTAHGKSDTDIAVLSRNDNREENKVLYSKLLQNVPSQFDVHVFELLPLQVQASVIDNYQVIY
ncbi:MAG: nucleotidyltransferase domain-containing protein, partial [Promethearchaeota archaeon]